MTDKKYSYTVKKLAKPKVRYKEFQIVEEPPQYRLIYFKQDDGKAKSYFIPTPWIYYRVVLSPPGFIDLIYMSPKKITSKNNWLSEACLLNQYGNRPCYYAEGTLNDFKTKREYINTALNQYWSSTFGTDGTITEHCVWREIESKVLLSNDYYSPVLKRWEQLSVNDIINMPWPQDIQYKDIYKTASYHDALNYVFEEEYEDDND